MRDVQHNPPEEHPTCIRSTGTLEELHGIILMHSTGVHGAFYNIRPSAPLMAGSESLARVRERMPPGLVRQPTQRAGYRVGKPVCQDVCFFGMHVQTGKFRQVFGCVLGHAAAAAASEWSLPNLLQNVIEVLCARVARLSSFALSKSRPRISIQSLHTSARPRRWRRPNPRP